VATDGHAQDAQTLQAQFAELGSDLAQVIAIEQRRIACAIMSAPD